MAYLVEITGKKKDKYVARVLTEKKGKYNGTHTLSKMTLYKEYLLIN